MKGRLIVSQPDDPGNSIRIQDVDNEVEYLFIGLKLISIDDPTHIIVDSDEHISVKFTYDPEVLMELNLRPDH